MADWSLPTVTSLYTDFLTYLKARDLDAAQWLDSGVVTVTSPSTDMKRWNAANRNFERYNGSSWVALAATYNISIDGAAGAVPFSGITSKPTTLAGYGITDAQGLDSDLTALAVLATTGVIIRTGAGTVATRSIAVPAAGIGISNADGVSGNPTLSLTNDLNGLEGLGSTGLAARTAADTWTTRSLQQPAAGLTVTNGDGVSGNPTLALANDLSALEGLGSTGIAVRTGADAWAQRSLTQPAAGITITNSDGSGGNPTFALANDLSALEGLGSTGIAVRTGADAWTQRTITVAGAASIANGDGVAGNPTITVTGGDPIINYLLFT